MSFQPPLAGFRIESASSYFNAQFVGQSRQQVHETTSIPPHAQHDQRIRVRIADNSPFGQVSGTIRISLIVDGKQLTSTVPVLAGVTGLVRCVPPQVVWANAVAGKQLRTQVRIECSADKIVDLSKLEFQSNISAIAARRVEPSSKEVVMLVTMTIPPDSSTGQLRGYVSGMIDKQEVFRLPVLAIVSR